MDQNYNAEKVMNALELLGLFKRGNFYKVNFSEYSFLILYSLNNEEYGYDAIYTTHPTIDNGDLEIELELKTNKNLKFRKMLREDMLFILARRYNRDINVSVEIVNINHNNIDLLKELKAYIENFDLVEAEQLLEQTDLRILVRAYTNLMKHLQ